jgi:hypothetical protein
MKSVTRGLEKSTFAKAHSCECLDPVHSLDANPAQIAWVGSFGLLGFSASRFVLNL